MLKKEVQIDWMGDLYKVKFQMCVMSSPLNVIHMKTKL
jgi:hypothetical protein